MFFSRDFRLVPISMPILLTQAMQRSRQHSQSNPTLNSSSTPLCSGAGSCTTAEQAPALQRSRLLHFSGAGNTTWEFNYQYLRPFERHLICVPSPFERHLICTSEILSLCSLSFWERVGVRVLQGNAKSKRKPNVI